MRVSDQQDRPRALRAREAFLVTEGNLPEGFGVYIASRRTPRRWRAFLPEQRRWFCPMSSAISPMVTFCVYGRKITRVRVLYRRNSFHNHFLLTERCNHYCLMCSQPPKNIDDSWIVDDVLATIPLIDPSTQEIGFTGGEPTLLGDDFFRILRAMKSYLPHTAIHILSNGRLFAEPEFAKRYADIQHFDMMVGIPIYSDVSTIHDYVVQSDGAFDETIRGILNLKRYGQKVEIRVVVHRQTYARLPQLAEFLARNLTFVDHVALWGLKLLASLVRTSIAFGLILWTINRNCIEPSAFWRIVGCTSRSITINCVFWTNAYGPSLASPSATGRMNTCPNASAVAKRKTAEASLPRQKSAIATTYGPFPPCENLSSWPIFPSSFPSKTLTLWRRKRL